MRELFAVLPVPLCAILSILCAKQWQRHWQLSFALSSPPRFLTVTLSPFFVDEVRP